MLTSLVARGGRYYFNKKTGETSWDPPPPTPEGDDKDVKDKLDDAKEAVKEGWRRTKQIAAVRVFKTTVATNDGELGTLYEKVELVERQVKGISEQVQTYTASLVDMCWSAEQLAAKFGDYMTEPGAVGQEAAGKAAATWTELQKGAQRSLEVQLTSKVQQPLVAYLAEIEGIKSLYSDHQKKLLDYDCACMHAHARPRAGRAAPTSASLSQPSVCARGRSQITSARSTR